jgi:hypothetical protein
VYHHPNTATPNELFNIRYTLKHTPNFTYNKSSDTFIIDLHSMDILKDIQQIPSIMIHEVSCMYSTKDYSNEFGLVHIELFKYYIN